MHRNPIIYHGTNFEFNLYVSVFLLQVSGTDMDEMDQEQRSMTLNSPNFPNYPDPDMERRCVIKENTGGTFMLETLETWATFEDTMDTMLNTHMQLYGITNEANDDNITSSDVTITRFNRFVNFTNFMSRELEQLRISYSSLDMSIKFTLDFEGKSKANSYLS